jgi:zinc/manganese transport system permease protein
VTALELLWLPFLACLILAGLHAYLGLHVLARGVIFVDLALAQVAALGVTTALLAGHPLQSRGAYAYALAFTGAGAALFALTRGRHVGVPQEAIIGIVYAVAAALTVLGLDRVPQGGEQIKQLLIGSILAVTRDDVLRLAGLYAVIGAVLWLSRSPLLALSLGGAVRGARAWDFFFYLTFGVVVVSSVQIAGVLLVFTYLIVPAVIGALVATTVARRLAIGWGVAFLASVAGLSASYAWDLPTGATIVATFGGALTVVALGRAGVALRAALRRSGAHALTPAGVVVGALTATAGLVLAAFPQADHYWLDAAEWLGPPIRSAFLSPHERAVFAESQAAVAHANAELPSLRLRDADAQWGTRPLPGDQRERLRQFVLGRSEMVAGDQAVLRTLRARVRERQRYVVGFTATLGGLVLGMWAWRGWARGLCAPRGQR